jgi:peptide deformylase
MSDSVSPVQPALDQASWLTATLPIRLYGDPILTTPCADVSPGELRDGKAKSWATAMEKFLRSYRAHTGTGRGLAANQIGISKRLVAIWVEEKPEIFINPAVIVTEGEGSYPEACLSSAALITGEVHRPWMATIKYETLDGNIRENQFDPLATRVLLHEIDHLHGKLCSDLYQPGTIALRAGDADEVLKPELKRLK